MSETLESLLPVQPARSDFGNDSTTRQEAARRACEAIGIKWPATRVPAGEALIDVGTEKLKSERADMASKPFAADAARVIADAVRTLDYRDFTIPANELRLSGSDGRLVSVKNNGRKPGLAYSPHTFRQLVGQVPGLSNGPRGTGSVLLHLTDTERAVIVNARIGNADPKTTVTVRTRLAHDGNRIARAILSEKYADVDDASIAEAIEGGLNGEARIARLDYKPGDFKSRFEVLWPSEIPVETFKVGDVHKAMVQIVNSETGQGSVTIRPAVVRAACYNLTLATGVGIKVSIRHLGNTERVRGQMRAAVGQAMAQIEPLVAEIVASAKTALPSGKSPSEMLAALAKKFQIGKSRVEDWTGTYEKKYAQHGATVWSLSSAITEAAQNAPWWVAQAEEEEVAAQLVHVRWNVLNDNAAVKAVQGQGSRQIEMD